MFLKEEVKVEAETSFKLTAVCFVETHFLALNNCWWAGAGEHD